MIELFWIFFLMAIFAIGMLLGFVLLVFWVGKLLIEITRKQYYRQKYEGNRK